MKRRNKEVSTDIKEVITAAKGYYFDEFYIHKMGDKFISSSSPNIKGNYDFHFKNISKFGERKKWVQVQ